MLLGAEKKEKEFNAECLLCAFLSVLISQRQKNQKIEYRLQYFIL